MEKNLIELTDDNFEGEVVHSNIPVIVDFYANWCMPCKMMSPMLSELSEELNGKVKIGKVDIEATSLTGKYNVSNVPTILFFMNGGVEHRLVGIQTKNDIKDVLMQGASYDG